MKTNNYFKVKSEAWAHLDAIRSLLKEVEGHVEGINQAAPEFEKDDGHWNRHLDELAYIESCLRNAAGKAN